MEIVVIGSGFGGMLFLRRMQRHAPAGTRYTLITSRDHFLFPPRLIEHFRGDIPRHQAMKPLAQLRLPHTTIITEAARRIDLRKKQVITASRTVPYDYLLLAPGSTTNFFGVPGAAEHCYTLKSYGDMQELRRRLEQLNRLQQQIAIAIVGGGYTGTELAFGLSDYFRKRQGQTSISIIQSGQSILPGMDQKLVAHVLGRLSRLGIRVLANEQAVRARESGLSTASGKHIPADIIIWTAGIAPNTIPSSPETPLNGGKYLVNASLQLPGYPEAFAIGDCATNALLEQHPASAQFTRIQAHAAAVNMTALLRHLPLHPLTSFREKGFIFLLDGRRAAMTMGKRLLTGTLPWLLRKIIYSQRFREI